MNRNRQPGGLRLVIVAAAVVALTVQVSAHDRTVSSSVWTFSEDRAEVFLTMNAVDAAGLRPLPAPAADDSEAALLERLGMELVLLADGRPCRLLEPPSRQPARAGRVNVRWTVSVPAAHDSLAIQSDLSAGRGSGHLHIATVRDAAGAGCEGLHALAAPFWQVSTSFTSPERHPSSSAASPAPAFRHLPVEPLGGLLLAALALAARCRRSLARTAATFLTGQITAALLIAMGVAEADSDQIVILASLSAVAMAMENVWPAGVQSWTLPCVTAAMYLLAGALLMDGVGHASIAAFSGMAVFLVCRQRWLRSDPRSDVARGMAALVLGLIAGFALPAASTGGGVNALLPVLALSVTEAALLLVLWLLLRGAVRRLGPVVVEAGSAACLALGLWWTLEYTALVRQNPPGRHPHGSLSAFENRLRWQISPTRQQRAAGFARAAALSSNSTQNQTTRAP